MYLISTYIYSMSSSAIFSFTLFSQKEKERVSVFIFSKALFYFRDGLVKFFIVILCCFFILFFCEYVFVVRLVIQVKLVNLFIHSIFFSLLMFCVSHFQKFEKKKTIVMYTQRKLNHFYYFYICAYLKKIFIKYKSLFCFPPYSSRCIYIYNLCDPIYTLNSIYVQFFHFFYSFQQKYKKKKAKKDDRS